MTVANDEHRRELDPLGGPLDVFLLAKMTEAPVVAPGVRADYRDNGCWFSLRSVIRDPDDYRPGAVGAWLDTMPTDRRCIVWAVVSDRLAGMLRRRGFSAVRRFDSHLGLWDDGAFVREGAK